MSEWKEYKLDEIAEVLNNKRVPLNSQQREKMKGIYPYYGASGIVDYVDSFLFDGEHVLISEDGENLRSRNTPIAFKANGRFWVNNHAHILKGKTDFLNDWIVYYFMRLDINPYITGAVQPKLNKENLLSIPIRMPDFKTVESIASILSSLDDKIELNNAINKNLEELAQALFKRWFVDFEFPCLPQNYRFSGHVNQASGITKPEDFDSVMTYSRVGGLPVPDGKSWFVYVLLCSNGSFYKGITNDLYRRFYEHFNGIGADWTKVNRPIKVIHWEAFNSKEDAAAREKELKTGYGRTWLERQYAKINKGSTAPECKLRMAGEMVESELGMIPKGWRVGTLGELSQLKKESTKPFSKPDDTYFHFSIPEFDGGKIPSIDLGANILSSKYRVFPHSVLVSKLNPRIPRIWPVIDCPINSVCSTEFQVIKPNEEDCFSFIACLASSENFISSLQSKITGTSSSHQRVNPKDIIDHKMIIPDHENIHNFADLVYPLFKLMASYREEYLSLKSLRDTLLPKLISGELEVNEAQAQTKTSLP